MNRKKKIAVNVFLTIVFVIQCTVFITRIKADTNTRTYDYAYDFWGVTMEAVPAFVLERTIDKGGTLSGINISGFDDVCSGGGRLFLVDSGESRLIIMDENFELITFVKLLYNVENRIALDEKGNQIMLTNPEGVFYHALTNEVFIADTGAERILVLDGDKFFFKRIIGRPSNMTGVTKFEPSKIAVDYANRIYIVVQSGFEGILELNEDGSFSRYFGVNKPKVNLLDYFWKIFSSNEQREKMAKTFAPSFNNVAIDADGFVYATTYDANSRDMVFRLNPKGENVLIQSREHPVEGDVEREIVTQFTAIAVNDYGVYALLDRSMGRIFIYNFYGEFMSVINCPSGMKGSFTAPAGIAWFGDQLVATDKQLRRAYVYTLTDFGRLALGSARHYYNGEWEASARLMEMALHLNSNYDLAYSAIGKYYLMQEDYRKAMYYLKLGQNRSYYSKAFSHYRNQWIKDNFIWFALLFLVCTGTIIYTEVRYHMKGGEKDESSA